MYIYVHIYICPIYVSDAPGKHDAALLRKLVTPDGETLRVSGVRIYIICMYI